MLKLKDSVAVITREKFELYTELRKSKAVDMSNIAVVCATIDLSRVEVMDLMKNYQDFYDKYNY